MRLPSSDSGSVPAYLNILRAGTPMVTVKSVFQSSPKLKYTRPLMRAAFSTLPSTS